jgi:heme/copper-type cytochrome/quinol oxidase subunit 3
MARFRRARRMYGNMRKAYKGMSRRRKKQTNMGMIAAVAIGAYFLFFKKP